MLLPLYDRNPHHRIPWLTIAIIVANVAVMFWLVQQSPQRTHQTVIHYGFIPQRIGQLENGQPVRVEIPQARLPGVRNRQQVAVEILQPDPPQVYLSMFTMMFLHGGWLHLISNMWMLWIFGNNVEDRLGHGIFVCFYVMGGLLASLAHWAIDPQSTTPVIGASGAVAAVLGGYAVTYPAAKVRTLIFVGIPLLVDLPALIVLGFWFLLEMIQGLGLIPGAGKLQVAFWAHIGGFIAGVVLMPLLGLGAPPAETDWRREADEMFTFDEPGRGE